MPVPIRDLPLARAFLEEGREEGRVDLIASATTLDDLLPQAPDRSTGRVRDGK